jgi:hypothetical protein
MPETQSMSKKATRALILGALLAAALISAGLAEGAAASPTWRFNGVELSGSESIQGDAIVGSFTIPTLTTTCKKTHYEMTISNVAGVGKGSVTGLTFSNCTTSEEPCTVKTIGAEKLPWAAHLVKIGASNYVVVEGIKIGIVYAGPECVLGGLLVAITGTAGGLYDNPTETFTFNATNFEATKTALKALSSKATWNAVFSTEALGFYAGEPLTVS